MMNRTQFTVDSGEILIMDPQFLQSFAQYFSYEEFLAHSGPDQDPQAYINEVAKKAFPRASGQLVGYLHGDGLLGDTEFVGDGRYELCSNAIRMTSQYRLVFETWLKNYGKRLSKKRVLTTRKSLRQHRQLLHRAK